MWNANNCTTSLPALVSGTPNCDGAVYEIVYTATDECGRTASCTQTFTIDNNGPTITCPAPVTLGRISDYVSGVATVTTSCGLSSNVTIGSPVLVSGNDCDGGVYEVTYTVTDACGRTAECQQQIFIQPSDLSCSIAGINTSCGENNGSASASISGGYAPYSYAWSNGQNTSSISGLAAGSYALTVTDSQGCTSVCTTTIAPSSNPICNATGVDASCGDANGSASVTVTQGTAPYSYLWTNGETTSSINGLLSGTYTVIVTDAMGCTTTCTVYIGDTVPPTCMAVGTPTSCNENNGSATVTGMGGSGTYTYLWSNGETTATINNLAPGTYTVIVTDGNGCTTSCSVDIADSTSPICSATSTDTSCGEANGTATVTASNGTPGYTYSWSNGGNTPTITGLASGTYSVTVTDAEGCTNNCSVTVGASSSPTCSITGVDTSCGENNGSAIVIATGGSGNYSYSWSNASTSNSISGLAPGTYSVTVTDGEGCTTSCSVTIAHVSNCYV